MPAARVRRLRRLVAAAALVPLAATLGPPPATADHHGNQEPGPVHAGNTFGWWKSLVYREEFHGTMPAYWIVDGPGVVRHQNGMLTLNTTDSGSVSATLDRAGVTTGHTERRRGAMSGVPLTVRFTMQDVPGRKMNEGRMQMDWLRHWSTETPPTRSVAAPRTKRGTYDPAC